MAKRKTTEKQKQLKRVRRYIREHERERGYRWEEKFKESIGKKTAKQLQELTGRELAKKATALSKVTGEVITGLEAQKETRSLAQKKSWEERRYKKQYGETPRKGDLIYRQLSNLIERYNTIGAKYLYTLIVKEEQEYGHERFIMYLDSVGEEVLAEAQDLVEYSSDDKAMINASYNKIIMLIRGAIPTEIEARYDGEITDSFEEYDEEDEEY